MTEMYRVMFLLTGHKEETGKSWEAMQIRGKYAKNRVDAARLVHALEPRVIVDDYEQSLERTAFYCELAEAFNYRLEEVVRGTEG